MTARNFSLILIILFIGVAIWLQKQYTGYEVTIEPNSVATAAPQPAAVRAASTASPVTPSVTRQEEIRQLVLQSQALQTDLSSEQQALDDMQSQLEDLKAQQTQLSAEPPAGAMTSFQVQANDFDIQTLSSSLAFFPEAERRIQQQAQQEMTLANSEAQLARDQLEQNIQLQESLIRQTQEDITFWQFGGSNYITEREARLSELQSLLAQQQDQLAAMRDQRMEVMNASMENRREIQAQSQQALRDLAGEQAEVQQQIGELRAQSWQGQATTYQIRSSQMTLRSQIQQLERAQQNQEQRVRTVQEAILQKEEQIRSLQ